LAWPALGCCCAYLVAEHVQRTLKERVQRVEALRPPHAHDYTHLCMLSVPIAFVFEQAHMLAILSLCDQAVDLTR